MFKRDLKLYLVDSGGLHYNLPIYPDVSYSQVYSEAVRENKTLHNPENTLETAYTTYLNPGNFSFTIPVMDDATARALFGVIFGNTAFDLYLEDTDTGQTLKFEKAIADSVVFNTARREIITASVSGSYSLTKDEDRPLVSVQIGGEIYTVVEGLQLTNNSVIQQHVANFSVEFSREVQWVNRNYMQDATPSYSADFVITKENLSGNYSLHQDLSIPGYGSNSMNFLIRSGGIDLLEFDFPSVTYSTRGQLDEILKTGVDYKVNLNANNQILYKGVNIL